MTEYVFKVEGMMCEHCSGRLQRVLNSIDGVENAFVSLAEKTATIKAPQDMYDLLKEAIEDAGFEVIQ